MNRVAPSYMYVNVIFDSPIVLPSATSRTIRPFIVCLGVLILCFEDNHSDCCLPICQSAFNISSMALLFMYLLLYGFTAYLSIWKSTVSIVSTVSTISTVSALLYLLL